MIGAVLAGGAGRRMLAGGHAAVGGAGSKAAVEVAGRPLAAWPAAALHAVCDAVAIVCKPDTDLPPIAGTERWDEPPEPRHPLTGIVFALERAGAPVMVCAADMPFVTPDACRSLLTAAGGAAGAAARPPAAVVAVADGALQPVLGIYAPAALDRLRDAPAGAPLSATVEALEPLRVALPAAVMRSVDTPEELSAAADVLAAATEPTWRRGRGAAGMP